MIAQSSLASYNNDMSKKVLIVDDAGFIREILSKLILSLGHHPYEASNGDEAIKEALDIHPDIIFMDLVMPARNGVEASQRILEVLPKVRIVAMSTLDDEMIHEQLKAIGVKDFMAKPFQKADVEKYFKSENKNEIDKGDLK
jgi:two-component system chemotaxis response regulator CheY